MIILKVKNEGFTLFLEDTLFEKSQGEGGGGQIDPPLPPAVLGLNHYFILHVHWGRTNDPNMVKFAQDR